MHSKKKGAPTTVSKACRYCGIWACRQHCKCEDLVGRHAPRIAGVALDLPAQAKRLTPVTTSTPPLPRPVPKPVGAPPAESCRRLKGESWWTHMQSDLKNARDLEIASYCMDEARLFNTVAELFPACKVNLYIDKEMLADATKEK